MFVPTWLELLAHDKHVLTESGWVSCGVLSDDLRVENDSSERLILLMGSFLGDALCRVSVVRVQDKRLLSPLALHADLGLARGRVSVLWHSSVEGRSLFSQNVCLLLG